MAKFLPILGQLRGSVAGNKFSRNTYGTYLARKSTPVNPMSPAQTLVRERMSGIAKAWSGTLTEVQRGAWRALCLGYPVTDIFGDSQVLTGIAMFVKVNIIRRLIGDVPLADPPSNLEVEPVLSAVLAAPGDGDSTLSVAFANDCTADERLVVRVAMNVAPGVQFIKNRLRFAEYSNVSQTTPFVVNVPARLGIAIESTVVWIQAQRYNQVNGILSPGVVTSAVVGP